MCRQGRVAAMRTLRLLIVALTTTLLLSGCYDGPRGPPGPDGPPGPSGAVEIRRAFDGTGETPTCAPNERLGPAICRGSGTPVMEGNNVHCAGATGSVGLCMRR